MNLQSVLAFAAASAISTAVFAQPPAPKPASPPAPNPAPAPSPAQPSGDPAAPPDAAKPAEHKEPKWLDSYTPPEREPSGDEEADGLLILLAGSFGTDPKAATETSPPLVWNAAPVKIEGLKNALYFEVARADDLPNPFRQGIISIFRRQGELRLRVLDFGGAPVKDAAIGLWAAPEVFPQLSVEKLSPAFDIPLIRSGDGSGYSGATRNPVPSVRTGAVEMTSQIRMTADGLLISDTGFDFNGKEVWRSDPATGVRFLHITPPATVRRRDDGLMTIDLVPGDKDSAPLLPGGQIALHFTQFLADGAKLDTSRAGNRAPVQTHVPVGSMKGLDDGIMGMAKGTRRRIIIPPALGFGKEGRGVIPPNSTVIFDIESLWQEAPPVPGTDINGAAGPAGPLPPGASPPPTPPPAGGGH